MFSTALMVGVHNLNEANEARNLGAQLIEAMHPTDKGLILPLNELRQITKAFEDVCPVSAFCGELPMDSTKWVEAIETLSAAAVDILILPIRFPGSLIDTLDTVGHITDLYPTCALINPQSLPPNLTMETCIATFSSYHWMGMCLELDALESPEQLNTLERWINLMHEADLMVGLSVAELWPELESLEADFIRLPLSAMTN